MFRKDRRMDGPVAPPCPAPDECLLLLARHGATAHNTARPPRLQGRRIDAELSAAGRRQAAELAAALRHVPLDGVFSSPLLRARQTAEAIAAPRGLAVQGLDALAECDVGLWEGCTWAEIEAADPDACARFRADPAAHPYAGGESFDDVRRRVVPALDALAAGHRGRTLAVVAHNIVNRVYLAHCLGLPLARVRELRQDNGGFNLLRCRDGAARVLTINAVLHLSAWE
jgi:broad specificity phosphatase PhoE